jgi:hypothetical protein
VRRVDSACGATGARVRRVDQLDAANLTPKLSAVDDLGKDTPSLTTSERQCMPAVGRTRQVPTSLGCMGTLSVHMNEAQVNLVLRDVHEQADRLRSHPSRRLLARGILARRDLLWRAVHGTG